MPRKRAVIHDEWISAMSEERKTSLNCLDKQHKKLESEIEEMALPERFIRAKEEQLAIRKKQAEVCQEGLEHSFQGGTIAKRVYDNATAQITAYRYEIGTEQVTLKKSKRTVSEDLAEMRPVYNSLEEAYVSIIASCIRDSCELGQAKNKERDRDVLRKAAYEKYECRRDAITGSSIPCLDYWCPISKEWHGPIEKTKIPPTKIAHIIPRAFLRLPVQTTMLFAEDTATLSTNPRNSLPMCKALEKLFDAFKLVIVPVQMEQGWATTEFRRVLIAQEYANLTYDKGKKYSEIDGVQLEFLNDFRPASCYLYLKYCCAFIYWKQLGQTKWAEDLPSKGYIWATPGQYLRRSMLTNLAKQSGDLFLPEAFYHQNTFDDKDQPEISEVDQDALNLSSTAELVHLYKETGRLPDRGDGSVYSETSEEESDW